MASPNAVVQVGDLTIDPEHHEVRLGGQPILLTATELRLLLILARAPGRVFSRTELMEQLFGWDYDGTERGVDAHIKNVRRKLERDPARPTVIETVVGVGYRVARPAGSQNDGRR